MKPCTSTVKQLQTENQLCMDCCTRFELMTTKNYNDIYAMNNIYYQVCISTQKSINQHEDKV
jgi:hypothetical protein